MSDWSIFKYSKILIEKLFRFKRKQFKKVLKIKRCLQPVKNFLDTALYNFLINIIFQLRVMLKISDRWQKIAELSRYKRFNYEVLSFKIKIILKLKIKKKKK